MLSLNQILEEVKERGLRVVCDPVTREASLAGNTREITPALMRVLRMIKRRLVDHYLGVQTGKEHKLREWKYASGQITQESYDDLWLYGHEERHPAGAWYFRLLGSDGEWQPVPGRGADPEVIRRLDSQASSKGLTIHVPESQHGLGQQRDEPVRCPDPGQGQGEHMEGDLPGARGQEPVVVDMDGKQRVDPDPLLGGKDAEGVKIMGQQQRLLFE